MERQMSENTEDWQQNVALPIAEAAAPAGPQDPAAELEPEAINGNAYAGAVPGETSS